MFICSLLTYLFSINSKRWFFFLLLFLINVLALVQENLLIYLNEECNFGEKRQIKVLLGHRDEFVLEDLLG